MVTESGIPLLVVALPLFGSGVLVWAARAGVKRRSLVTNLITLGTFLLTLWQFLLVQNGQTLTFTLPWSLGFGLRWRVDFIGATFAAIVALVWLLATLFAEEYMEKEHGQTRYSAASIFTLGSTLGVFLAGDLFSLFLFFELMTFAAYLLVIHAESEEALQAGHVYLFMSVIGGLFLLGVIFFLQHLTGTTEFVPVLDQIMGSGINPWWLFLAVILGFGVKAGMLPLHIWLPKAHPVAPAPASALLSALMIKTGAYGFLRFFYVLFTASGNSFLEIQENFGYVFIWIGAVTMLGGALMALVHSPMKRVLAYSSISQMGYILFSLGVGVMLGYRGAFGFAGTWLHMINHAFFKSFLFLLAGAVYLQTGELDLNKLGGLKKRMPVTLGFFLVAAAGITGIPGFNGYVSKVLIHDGILQAYELKGWPSLLWLERVFVFTGGLTAAYISKIWLKAFFGKAKKDLSKVNDLSTAHTGIFAIYTIILLSLGLSAQAGVKRLVLPAAGFLSFHELDLAHLQEIPFWSRGELMGPVYSYLIALGALLISVFFLAKLTLPRWLSVEVLVYKPIYGGARSFFALLARWGSELKLLQLPRPKWRLRIDWRKPRRIWVKIRPADLKFRPLWRPRRIEFSKLKGVFVKLAEFFRKIKTSAGQKLAQAVRFIKERTDLVFDTVIIALIFILLVFMILTR